MPVTRRKAVRMAWRGTRRANRGRQWRSNMACNSCGGPGSRITTAPDSSTHCPGAVPRSLESASAPSITKACRLLISAILRPARAKRCSRAAAISEWKLSLRSSACATASRVTSSSVGPRPPDRMTISPQETARRTASARRLRSSPITHFETTSTPMLFSCAVRYRELVSSRCGVSISDPTAMISAFIESSLNSDAETRRRGDFHRHRTASFPLRLRVSRSKAIPRS